jgi:hypothetical protein
MNRVVMLVILAILLVVGCVPGPGTTPAPATTPTFTRSPALPTPFSPVPSSHAPVETVDPVTSPYPPDY